MNDDKLKTFVIKHFLC